MPMQSIPRDLTFDSTLAVRREGYNFISNHSRHLGADVFETRIFLRRVICMTGEEAARLFYDTSRFERRHTFTMQGIKTLTGPHAVQTLDGEAHRVRKALFMSIMTRENIARLAALSRHFWEACLIRWERQREVVVYDEARDILLRTACAWAGVPLKDNEVKRRAADCTAIFEAHTAMGPRYWKGRFARLRSQIWLMDIVQDMRTGRLWAGEDSPIEIFARARDHSGRVLDLDVAACEVLNLIRPMVEVAVFVVFSALALLQHSEARERINNEPGYDTDFVTEVRRRYAFFPFIPARVRKDFEWNGFKFTKGRCALLDVYGTNHDERLWEDPFDFRPGRFKQHPVTPFNMLTAGGGDITGHRCAGEAVTAELVKVAVHMLAGTITYDVPMQDLRVDPAQIPFIPASGFIIRNVKRVPQPESMPVLAATTGVKSSI